jgi:hypothetical protein
MKNLTENILCEGCENNMATGTCDEGKPWCDLCGIWNLDIGQAMMLMEDGLCVTRPGWNGKGMYLYLSPPMLLRDGTLTEPIVMMKAADGTHVAWTCSQTDLRAKDWMLDDISTGHITEATLNKLRNRV